MRIYLDVCCLNRPFNDQRQKRVRLESEAVRAILAMIDQGHVIWVTSDAVELEIRFLRRVRRLAPPSSVRVENPAEWSLESTDAG